MLAQLAAIVAIALLIISIIFRISVRVDYLDPIFLGANLALGAFFGLFADPAGDPAFIYNAGRPYNFTNMCGFIMDHAVGLSKSARITIFILIVICIVIGIIITYYLQNSRKFYPTDKAPRTARMITGLLTCFILSTVSAGYCSATAVFDRERINYEQMEKSKLVFLITFVVLLVYHLIFFRLGVQNRLSDRLDHPMKYHRF